jgi:hypothetical protein
MGPSQRFSRIWIASCLNIFAKTKDLHAQSPMCGFWGVCKIGLSQCFSRIWIAFLNISESWHRWGCRGQGEGRPERPQARSSRGGTFSQLTEFFVGPQDDLTKTIQTTSAHFCTSNRSIAQIISGNLRLRFKDCFTPERSRLKVNQRDRRLRRFSFLPDQDQRLNEQNRKS